MTSKVSTLLLLLLGSLGASVVTGQISQCYQQFLTYHGQDANNFLKPQLGTSGSFGGGTFPDCNNGGVAARKPVIIVPDRYNPVCGDYIVTHRAYLLQNGFDDTTVYCSTYAAPSTGSGNVQGVVPPSTYLCSYAMLMRVQIILTHQYTSQKVIILALCNGGPIAQMAIAGGSCTDISGTYNLGPALGADHVHLFLSVAAPNYGSILCNNRIAQRYPDCQAYGYACGTQWLNYLHSQPVGFLGTNVATIRMSTNDNIVGTYAYCSPYQSTLTTSIPGSNSDTTVSAANHNASLYDIASQYSIINAYP